MLLRACASPNLCRRVACLGHTAGNRSLLDLPVRKNFSRTVRVESMASIDAEKDIASVNSEKDIASVNAEKDIANVHADKEPMKTPGTGYASAQGMLDYVNASWTQFHAVDEASKRLAVAGFKHLREKDPWQLEAGGKYYFTRNASTIVAFAVGRKYQPGNGFYMINAHTDSPCLKLKPNSKLDKSGYLMVNVETYGGGLWYTWFDRDLSVAGRVFVRKSDASVQQHLVRIEKPILKIPMLAIHLQRGLYESGFKPNHQDHLVPMLATAIKGQLDDKESPPVEKTFTGTKHHPLLLQLLAEEIGCSPADIFDFELNVCDVQPGVIMGAKDEFISVGRLDNLAMCWCSLQALIDSTSLEGALDDETGVRAVALFDHEEVGSDSAQGAGGPVMRDTITRVARILSSNEEGAVERCLRQSFLVSADMAHGLHPNYPEKHDPEHQPRFHSGLVIKHNQNQRYATNAVSASLFREVGRQRGLPCQEFSVRNDMPCGSTIGPILASSLGCRTVDVGIAQFAMHSIRETCGTEDIGIAYDHFKAFFETFSQLDNSIDVDSLPPPDIRGTIADTPCTHVHNGDKKLIDVQVNK